jgi:hypothetical protein
MYKNDKINSKKCIKMLKKLAEKNCKYMKNRLNVLILCKIKYL